MTDHNRSQEKRIHKRVCPSSLKGVHFEIPGKTENHFGLINNISATGIGITSPIDVLPETLIKIWLGDKKEGFVGEVRWCVPAEYEIGSYYLGVQAIRRDEEF